MIQDDPKQGPRFPPQPSLTNHSLVLGDLSLHYRAIAEWIALRRLHEAVAHVFHVAYLAEPADNPERPLTFVFNGGPGAASAYLHMGAMGPKRVAVGKAGTLPPPPVRIVDNSETWLSFTDLVFIDPIGTGFSRSIRESGKSDGIGDSKPAVPKFSKDASATEPRESPEFWEIDRDLESLGEFITRFLSEHHRWMSPLFIAGESYGGFRVARMTRKLQENHGVSLCGALLISPVIEYDSQFGTDYNLTYWIELFPSLAAAAHHHGRSRNVGGDATGDSVRAVAEEFARERLARLLIGGEGLSEEERKSILRRASELVGLPIDVLDRAGGRMNAATFCRQLLRDERRLCGRLDASVTTIDPFPDRNDYEGPDPTIFSMKQLFAGAINHHLRLGLGVHTDLDYRLLSKEVIRAWRDDSKGQVFRKPAGAMDELRYGMSLNEHMRILVAHGHFDLVTPYYGSRRLVELMKLTAAQRHKLTVRTFDGGHMFYLWDESRKAFRTEAERFYGAFRE